MASDAIVFPMANPMPEVAPEEIESFAAVIGTGRSDYPNQINNVLAFPGVFRGALDVRATAITEPMELAAPTRSRPSSSQTISRRTTCCRASSTGGCVPRSPTRSHTPRRRAESRARRWPLPLWPDEKTYSGRSAGVRLHQAWAYALISILRAFACSTFGTCTSRTPVRNFAST